MFVPVEYSDRFEQLSTYFLVPACARVSRHYLQRWSRAVCASWDGDQPRNVDALNPLNVVDLAHLDSLSSHHAVVCCFV